MAAMRARVLPAEEEEIEIDLQQEYTLEEFEALPDDGNRYELIEGKLVMSPATKDEHGRIAGILYRVLADYLEETNAGMVWFTTGFYLGKKLNGKDNVPEPDLGVIVGERVPALSNKYLPYPDLAVEIWSRDSDAKSEKSKEKARRKIAMFLKAGTRFGWGINPIERTVEIFEQATGITPVETLQTGQDLSCEALLPGFKVSLNRLFGVPTDR